MNQSQLIADQTAQADEDRTKRLFVGFLSSVLGVDQTMNGVDAVPTAGNSPGQYVIANPDGTFSVQGQSVSNLNIPATVAGVPVGLLLMAALAFVLLR